jgi:hypothetical protein
MHQIYLFCQQRKAWEVCTTGMTLLVTLTTMTTTTMTISTTTTAKAVAVQRITEAQSVATLLHLVVASAL